MSKLKFIKLDTPAKNIVCHKPKRVKECQSRGVPKTVTKVEKIPLCLKCENPFIPEKGFKFVCEVCRRQNNRMGDFGNFSHKGNSFWRG